MTKALLNKALSAKSELLDENQEQMIEHIIGEIKEMLQWSASTKTALSERK